MGNEDKNSVFKIWIDSIPYGEYSAVRSKIIADCYITPQVFRHWKIGSVRVPPLAQEKINTIAGKEIFEIAKIREQIEKAKKAKRRAESTTSEKTENRKGVKIAYLA